jgi:DNA-binding response OmpR family regulator
VILVVDDDISMRRKLQQILTDAGLDVVLADDGIEALSALSEQEFDLVFLDVMMPGLNGLECLRILGRSFPRLKVCMLTSLQEQDLLTRLSGYGAADCLGKPIDTQRVLRKVNKLCALPA